MNELLDKLPPLPGQPLLHFLNDLHLLLDDVLERIDAELVNILQLLLLRLDLPLRLDGPSCAQSGEVVRPASHEAVVRHALYLTSGGE